MANRMGDGKSMGYDVVAVVVELLLAPPPSLLAISDVVVDDDTAADTFAPTSPSFANRCEEGSGGNPTTTSFCSDAALLSSSSLVLARNTTCTLVNLANDLVVVVVGNGERLKLDGNLIADVDADVAALFTTVQDVHVNASTEDEKSEDRTTITAMDDAADFMVAVLNTFVMLMVIIVVVIFYEQRAAVRLAVKIKIIGGDDSARYLWREHRSRQCVVGQTRSFQLQVIT